MKTGSRVAVVTLKASFTGVGGVDRYVREGTVADVYENHADVKFDGCRRLEAIQLSALVPR